MFDNDTQHGWTFVFGPIYAFRCNNLIVVTIFGKEVFSYVTH